MRSPNNPIYKAGIFLWVPAFLFLALNNAWSADIQVTASVDRKEITLEDSVNFSVVIEGTQSASPPELPPLDSFTVKARGSSSSFQIINGDRSSSITYNYILLPKKTGTFTIAPAIVNIEEEPYQTAPITLIVKKASARTNARRMVFAKMVVSNKKPFVQEQITATLQIFHIFQIRNIGVNIGFPGFREESLKEPVQNTRIVDGIRYSTYEISTSLFPMRPGKVEIPVHIIELDQVDRSRVGRLSDPSDPFGRSSIFNNFGRLKHKTLKTKAVTIDVQPLPQKNRPQNFSNLVGDFIISSHLSRRQIEAGDTTTLTVTVAGQGNIKDLSLPSPQWGNDFKVYEDQSDFQQTNGAKTVSGEKVYTYALVPQVPGTLEIPSVSLNYFDPTKGDYVSIQTQALSLTVLPTDNNSKLKVVESESGTTDGIGDSTKTGEDILPIHTGPEIFKDQRFSNRSGILYGIGVLLPAGLFLIYSGFYKRQQRLKYDVAFSRSHRAYDQATRKLNALSPDNDSRKMAQELSLIIREYLGNVLNLQGTAITSTEVEEKLTPGNFSAKEITATRELLEKHETFQYAPTEQDLSEDLSQETRKLLDLLEKKS